jgi:Methyltransferase domain
MYDTQFFDTIREGIRASAAAMVPELISMFRPTRIIDVGCGEGWWAAEFVKYGVEAIGIDGPGTRTVLDRFIAHDLAIELPDNVLGETHDLAVCLEVAEHLPPHRAPGLIVDLCELAPVVVFSAAVPGQGGTGHVNEQWPGYWVQLFERCGFQVSGALRWRFWNDSRVENWYRQNVLVAARRPQDHPALFDTPLSQVFPVVHPVLYNARRT